MSLLIAFLIGLVAVPLVRGVHKFFWLRREETPIKVTTKERLQMFERDER